MKRFPIFFIAALTAFLLLSPKASASVQIDYAGSVSGTIGLKATAIFSLISSTKLEIELTNSSMDPFGGSGVNGDANMVLSSINFDLGSGILITGGSVALNASTVVKRSGSSWATDGSYSGSLDDEYGYSNTGVGNSSGGGAILSDISASQVNSLLDGAATSHSNGGMAVTTFNGTAGGVGGGLDFGLVATGSDAFGNKNFILDSLIITLNLDNPLSNLDFLENGSYVEFGSDYAYVGENPPIPEPHSFAIWGGIVALAYGAQRKGRRFWFV